MGITRAQYLQGNTAQGTVLANQVQGVKQGAGTLIASDGTISVNAATAVGLVKLNNGTAFNSYVWPGADGSQTTFLSTDGAGNLTWAAPASAPTVTVSEFPPTNPQIGQLWFDCNEGLLKVREDCDGVPQWTPSGQGKEVDANNVTADPDFTDGDGTLESPYVMESQTTTSGSSILFRTTVTISGLAPYQFVPIYDANGEENDYRFTASNFYADGTGTLKFRVAYTDKPNSAPSTSYSAEFLMGAQATPVRMIASVTIVAPVSLLSTGSVIVSGGGEAVVGSQLEYTVGSATGGNPPYAYTWIWRRESDNSILQTNGDFYSLTTSDVDNRVYVELTATDESLDTAFGNTTPFPASPATIQRGSFPLTDILYPSTIPGEVSTTWLAPGTEIQASGCIEFSVDNVTWGQGSRSIANGGTITTRWLTTSTCGEAPNGSTLTGTIFSSQYQDVGTITLDQVPAPFTFLPVVDITPGQVATSQAITPIGFNDTAHVTYRGTSSGTNIQASINGGAWTTIPLLGDDTLPINPGETIRVRFTTGSGYSSNYDAIINIGVGTSVQSATFTATTAVDSIFDTLITAPVTTEQETASAAWIDGSMNLVATGCIEFKVGVGGTWGQSSTAIVDGDVLYLRWVDSAGCGQAAHGTTITGQITGGAKQFDASLTIDRVPAQFAFTDVTNQNASSVITSNTIQINGINAPAYVTKGAASTLTNIEINIGNTSWVPVPSSGQGVFIDPVVNGTTGIQIRGTTGSASNTAYTAVINIGQGSSITSDTWSATTANIVPTIVTPTAISPVNGSTNLNPNSSSPSGITLTSSAYQAINGAGIQLNSDWEVRRDSTGGTIVKQVTSTTSLNTFFLAVADLAPNVKYFWRVRYRSVDSPAVVSQYSNWSEFTTATSFGLNWVLRQNFSTDLGTQDRRGPGLIWANGQFISVGKEKVFTSPDGLTFTRRNDVPNSSDLVAITWDGTKLVAVDRNNNGRIFTSTNNGISWTQINTTGISNNPRTIAYANGLYVLGTDAGNAVFTSTNLTTWTPRAISNISATNFLTWTGTKFYGVTGNRYVISSFDGIVWDKVQLSQDGLASIAYHNGIYIVGTDNDAIWRSTDGSTFTRLTTPNGAFDSVAGGGIWFVATGRNNRQINSSTTGGTSWNVDVSNLANDGGEVAFSPTVGRFVVVTKNAGFYSTTTTI